MKKFFLVSLIFTFPCLAMDDSQESIVHQLRQLRETTVNLAAIENYSLPQDGKIKDEGFFIDVFDNLIKDLSERYKKINQCFETAKAKSYDKALCDELQINCQSGMILIEDILNTVQKSQMRIALEGMVGYQGIVTLFRFHTGTNTMRQFFVKIVNLLEKFHTLRVDIIAHWIADTCEITQNWDRVPFNGKQFWRIQEMDLNRFEWFAKDLVGGNLDQSGSFKCHVNVLELFCRMQAYESTTLGYRFSYMEYYYGDSRT